MWFGIVGLTMVIVSYVILGIYEYKEHKKRVKEEKEEVV